MLTGCLTTTVQIEPILIAIPEPPVKPDVSFSRMDVEAGRIYYLTEADFRKFGKYLNDMQDYSEKLAVYLNKYYNTE